MNSIIFAVLSVTGIGFICAAILSVASRVMAVEVDERVALIVECLPGVNCGACGFSGCAGYADALVSGDGARSNLCIPGGAETTKAISAVLGVDAGETAHKVAVIRCGGDHDTRSRKMDYIGIDSCAAAKLLHGGAGSCAFGCLGYGDCRVLCPNDAICVINGLARVNPGLCVGCGLCARACPNDVITVENSVCQAVVICRNIEKGAIVRGKCRVGCIACGRCAGECPSGAIELRDNLAVIDQDKCSNCGHCVSVCPIKCLKPSVQTTRAARTA